MLQSLLPSHGDRVLVSHLAPNQPEIAQTAGGFTPPSGPGTDEEDEDVMDGNIGLVSSESRTLVSSQQAGLPKILDGTKDSKELTDGSNTVQQQEFAIVSMDTADNDNRSSDPSAPTVAEDANLPDPLVGSAKDALSSAQTTLNN